jgi:hypothetical protein
MLSGATATVGNSKALMGTLFIQYCAYSIFYLLDEIFEISQEHYTPLLKDTPAV